MKKKKSKSSASAPASTNSITSPPHVVNRLSSMKVSSSRKSPASVLHAASPRSSSKKVSSNRKSPASVLCAASPRSPSKKVSSSRKSPASLLPGASPKRSHDSPQSNDRRHKAKKIGTNTAANLSKKASRHTASRHTAALASPTSTVTTESSSPSSTISSPATPRSNASDRRRAKKTSSVIKKLSINHSSLAARKSPVKSEPSSDMKPPPYNPAVNVFYCDLMKPEDCRNLILGNIPDIPQAQQIEILKMNHRQRIEETTNSFTEVNMVRILYQKICCDLQIEPNPKARTWNIATLTKNIIALVVNDEWVFSLIYRWIEILLMTKFHFLTNIENYRWFIAEMKFCWWQNLIFGEQTKLSTQNTFSRHNYSTHHMLPFLFSQWWHYVWNPATQKEDSRFQ